jgi:hypothetical protein
MEARQMTTLFDSARVVKPVAFGCGLPATGTFGTFHDALPAEHRPYAVGVLIPADMQRIDAVRVAAYRAALAVMPEAEAEDAAGDAATAEHDAIVATKAARLYAEAQERRAGYYREALDREMTKAFPGRKPYTAADLEWWAANSPANEDGYTVVGLSNESLEFNAGCALVQARLDAGMAIL